MLSPYNEHFTEVEMEPEQAKRYKALEATLTDASKKALRTDDNSLLDVVLNCLLAWPDTCLREEMVKHPRSRQLLAFIPTIIGDEASPKEAELIQQYKPEKARGRRVLVYTAYTGKRDTTARLKNLLEAEGFKTAVFRACVDTCKREDWICDQVERGVDVIITNPELIKTGLNLLDFPGSVRMQSGFDVYTLQQVARRSWRRSYLSVSLHRDMPDTGLDVLNQDGDSLEVALAKQLIH